MIRHCEHPTPLRGHESAKNDPVIPVQAGIQAVQSGFLDSGLRQNDGASSSSCHRLGANTIHLPFEYRHENDAREKIEIYLSSYADDTLIWA